MPQAMQACVMSKTPQASPPQKMARKAFDEGAVGTADAEAAVMRDSVGLCAQKNLDVRGAILFAALEMLRFSVEPFLESISLCFCVSVAGFPLPDPRSSAQICVKALLSVRLQQLLRML